MSHRRTASKLALADACPPSHVLDWVAEESSEAAERGTGIHLALERIPVVGLEAAVTGIPDEWARVVRAVAATPWIAPLLVPGAASAEVAMEWVSDIDRGKQLGTGREAYARATIGAITGTADVLAVTDDKAIVLDWKTGRKDLGPIAKNLQLRFLALAASRAFGRDCVLVAIAYTKDGEDAWVTSTEFDALDLEGIATELRGIQARVAAVDLADSKTYNRGPHCTEMYCPARAA